MTFHQLLHTDLEQLIDLSNQHPYFALYSVAAAKKASMQNDNRYEKLLAKAAIRVPSRMYLKKIIIEDIQVGQLKDESKLENSKKSEHDQLYSLDNENKSNHLSHQEAKEIVNRRKVAPQPLQKAKEYDKGEIVLSNPNTVLPYRYHILPDQEIVIDGQIQLLSLKLSEKTNKDILVDSTTLSETEQKQSNNIRISKNEKTVNPIQNDQSLTDRDEAYNQDVQEQSEKQEKKHPQDVSFSGFGHGRSQFGAHRRDIEDFGFSPEEVLHSNLEDDSIDEIGKELVDEEHLDTDKSDDQKSLRNIRLPIEDDSIDEIGDELVDEEEHVENQNDDLEVEIFHIDQKPVSSLSTENEGESMYKKIVQLLQESEEANQSHTPVVVDADYNTVDELEEEEDIEIPSPQEAMKDALDDELESLYAQAAYEAGMEKEIAQKDESVMHIDWRRPPNDIDSPLVEKPLDKNSNKDESKEVSDIRDENNIDNNNAPSTSNQLANPNQTHSFSGWLGQLSRLGVNFAQEQKEHQQKQEVVSNQTMSSPKKAETRSEAVSETEENKTDRPELTTKEVQELARKSMQHSKAFYTETLAYVYELQEKWTRAIEVYEQLSLQNPEKSAYFANQIKLLKEKL